MFQPLIAASAMGPLGFLGLMLFSSWVNLILFAWGVFLAFRFFLRFRKGGRKVFHALVAALLVSDIVGTIGTCATAWITLIEDDSFAASEEVTKYRLWTFPMMLLATNFSSMLEQLFLTYRIYLLSRTRAITCLLVFLVFTHATLTTSCAVLISLYGLSSRIVMGNATMIFGGAISATVDLLIPAVLVWKLHSIRSGFGATKSSGISLVRKVCIESLTSGLLVAFLGLIAVILFTLADMEFIIFWSCLGRVYGATVVISLLGRKDRPRNATSVEFTPTTRATSLPLTTVDPLAHITFRETKELPLNHDIRSKFFNTIPPSLLPPTRPDEARREGMGSGVQILPPRSQSHDSSLIKSKV